MTTTSVVLYDMANGAKEVKEALYTLPAKEALICAIEQNKGNYNWWDYPKNIEGIYPSKVIKGRLFYDITDNLILCATPD